MKQSDWEGLGLKPLEVGRALRKLSEWKTAQTVHPVSALFRG
jgi:hypothetical protein